MSALSKLVRNIAPKIAGITSISPNPTAQVIGLGAGLIAQDTVKKQQQAIESQTRKEFSMQYPGGFDPVTGQLLSNTTTGNAGNRGFFDGISDFFTTAGRTVKSAFDSGIPQLFGVGRPRGTGQQPAITTVTNVGAQESQGSGSIQAGMGSLLPSLIGTARSLLKTPLGQTAIGTGAGFGLSMLGGDGKTMRMTRKMKSQARMLLNLTGGNLSVTADFLGISEEALVALLLKRFRNDGPVVTKAALRKTKSTIRKMKNMCDMYDDLRPAARRRSPVRRATRSSTTLIKN